MTKQLDTLISGCESALRLGRIHDVRVELARVKTAAVPRAKRLPLANICRRAGLIRKGLMLLTATVHETHAANQTPASSAELAEYAVLLQRSGVVREALLILNRIPQKNLPEAGLYLAYCHFNLWQYERAILPLKSFLASGAPEYLKLVGLVNLAGAFVALNEREQAHDTLNAAMTLAESAGNGRLIANCLELRAQVEISVENWSAARVDLERAKQILDAAGTLDELFVRKWLALISSREMKSPDPLLEFRRLALSRGDGDSVRQADRHLLDVQYDQDVFDHLIFGTPYSEYQQSVCQSLGRAPSRAVYTLGSPDCVSFDTALGETVDLRSGKSRLETKGLEAGSQGHRLVEVLFRDFYRPLTIGGIFSELFPDERFNIMTSPDRVHKAIQRARDELKGSALQIEILEQNGRYRAKLGPQTSIRVHLERPSVDWDSVQLRKLRRVFSSSSYFKAQDARNVLGLSSSAFKRFTSRMVDDNKIEQSGASSATVYRLKHAA